MGQGATAAEMAVRNFRQVLIWPVQIVADESRLNASGHADRFAVLGGPWKERSSGDRAFDRRHHAEFVSFMPDVQRFLYGESDSDAIGASPIRIFRRNDIATARATLVKGQTPIDFAVCRVDLYFFYDIDLAILVVELGSESLTLADVQDTLFALGRAYPTTWDTDGNPVQCCASLSLLGTDGSEVARSDYEQKDRYLSFLRKHRGPRIADHWAHLFAPLSLWPEGGGIECCLLEHQQIPQLAYIAVDDPELIVREDWVRLGLASAPGAPEEMPYAERFLDRFEKRHCYDRFWDPGGAYRGTAVRILNSGTTFVMAGKASDPHFTDSDAGIFALFRHQYFLIGLIVHCHHSALLIFRDRLATAISILRDYSAPTVRRFKRRIRLTHENFLRFTHRYWFHEVSNQLPPQEVFDMWLGQIGSDQLFREVREEVQDMIDYLDSDGLRRQANSVVRLTVVTFFGLIGTVATGFLGMNIFNLTDKSPLDKLVVLTIVLVLVAVLTFYTAAKSQRLAEFLEAVSDERRGVREKFAVFMRIWRKGR